MVTQPQIVPPQISLSEFILRKLNDIGPMSKEDLITFAMKDGMFPDAESTDSSYAWERVAELEAKLAKKQGLLDGATVMVEQIRVERDEARRQAEQLRAMLRPVLSPATLDVLARVAGRGDSQEGLGFLLAGAEMRAVQQAVSIVRASAVVGEVQDG